LIVLGLVVRQEVVVAQRRPWEVEDGLWELIEPLLPAIERRFRYPGRKRLDDRKALCGIGVRAVHGYSVGVPAAGDGVWVGDDLLASPAGLARSRGVAAAARAAVGRVECCRGDRLVSRGRGRLSRSSGKRGPKTGPSPVDRARTGSKHHLISDGGGIPLAVLLTGGNRHDVTQLVPLLEAVPAVRGTGGRPRRRPDRVYADRGYDYDRHRRLVRTKGIRPIIAQRGVGHGSGLGVYRWVVEQAFALLHWFRRLRIRWEIRDDIHEAFLSIGCSIICWRRLKKHSLC
jgi:transposase